MHDDDGVTNLDISALSVYSGWMDSMRSGMGVKTRSRRFYASLGNGES